MNNHRQLHIWQRAGELITVAYQISGALPAREAFVAIPQIRRAAWSVQNNVAEGNAKRGQAERRRFFDIALGSLAEVDSIIATLSQLYRLDPELEDRVENLRREITAGLFSLLRNGDR